jgi:hypothetical protein
MILTLLRCIVRDGGSTARSFGEHCRRPAVRAEKIRIARRLTLRRLFATFAAVVVAGPAWAEDVVWRPAEPLLTNLSRNGEMVETGNSFDWSGTKKEPAAKVGPLLPLPRPAPEGTERPLPLPGTLTELPGPTLPVLLPKPKPVLVIPTGEPPRRVRESFAVDSNSLPPSVPTPVREFTSAKVSVEPSRPQTTVAPRPQPWAPRQGQRTIISELFDRPSR